jgi:hypothetical protein
MYGHYLTALFYLIQYIVGFTLSCTKLWHQVFVEIWFYVSSEILKYTRRSLSYTFKGVRSLRFQRSKIVRSRHITQLRLQQVFTVSAISAILLRFLESSPCPRVPRFFFVSASLHRVRDSPLRQWVSVILHRVREFSGLTQTGSSVSDVVSVRDSSSCPRVQWTDTDRTFCEWRSECP